MRKATLVIAAATTALASFGMVPTAHAEKTCFGREATVLGTNGDDDIYVSADEAGVFVRINGKTYDHPSSKPIAIVGGDGDDKITFSSDGGGGAVVCSGKGNDDIDGTMMGRLSTGPGKDRVEMYLQCGISPDVYGAETVVVTGFDSEEEGPCN